MPIDLNCVFSAFSFSLFDDIQRPMSSMHGTRRGKTASLLLSAVVCSLDTAGYRPICGLSIIIFTD